jgi:spermidine/putrescine transport system permease protein
MTALVVLPLISIVIYAIVQPTGDAIMFKITIIKFLKMFSDSNIMIALLLSIAYALVAALLCVFIGYPIALMMAQIRSQILAKNI